MTVEEKRAWIMMVVSTIANAIHLCFFLSAIVGSIARIAAYRWGFQ